MTDFIYQVDADGVTPKQVAEQFAREYWDKPRDIHRIWRVGSQTHFSVKDGTRTYKIVHSPIVPDKQPACYRIAVADHERR